MCNITYHMHCKDVSIYNIDSEITENSIAELMHGWRSYIRTEFLVLKDKDKCAIIRLFKKRSKGLFQDVYGYEIISLPYNTIYYEDRELDVLNVPKLARVQQRFPGKAVVLSGMFSHVSFIKDIIAQRLIVMENVPPYPPKLSKLVDIALDSGFIGYPILKEECIFDISKRIDEVNTEAVIFPCKVSGLNASIPSYFLDDAPIIQHKVTLIGCHLSKRIYIELYGHDVPFINICPLDSINPNMKTIVRCCKVKQGYEIHGNIACVPWGVTVPEVVNAINKLFSTE